MSETIKVDGLTFHVMRSERRKTIAEHYTRAAHPCLNDIVGRWKKVVGVEPAKHVKVIGPGFPMGFLQFRRNVELPFVARCPRPLAQPRVGMEVEARGR